MSAQRLLVFSREILWVSLTGVFALLCILPVAGIIADGYVRQNLFLAVLFAFYFRAVIFFRQTPYLQLLAIQILLFFGNIPLFIIVLGKMQDMFYLFDSYDLVFFFQPAVGLLPDTLLEKFQFYRNEFLFFSTGTLILIVFTELRLVMAFVHRIKKIE